jgi:hypothetical protein
MAVGMAAICTNDEIAAAVFFTLTVSILCTATLISLYRPSAWAGGRWTGFVIFGWAQFWISQPHLAPPVGPTPLAVGLACRLVPYATKINSIQPSFRIGGYPAISSDDNGNPVLMAVFGGHASHRADVPVHSLRTVLCLMSLVSGSAGAIVGSVVVRLCGARSSEQMRTLPINHEGGL